MINTSAQYKHGIRTLPVQQHTLSATLAFADGSVTAYLTQANFLAGSVQVTNQLADSGNVCVGTAYIGMLECTLILDNVTYTSLRDARITLSMTVSVGSTYEDMPLGIYTVKSATLTDEGIKITAYDDMSKLDKDFYYTASNRTKTAHDWYTYICNQCGVGISSRMTAQYFADTFWCGNISLALAKNLGDVATYRGLVAKLSQILCAYAVVDRYGQLVIVPANVYAQTSEYLLDTAALLDSYSIADYKMLFGGFYYKLAPNAKSRYYGYSEEGCNYMSDSVIGTAYTPDTEYGDLQEKKMGYESEKTEINSKEAQLLEDLIDGKITQAEYDRMYARYEDEKDQLDNKIDQVETEMEELDYRKAYYTSHISPAYANALSMDFGYNPFIQTLTWEQGWLLATAITQITFTPFEYTMVGDYGYELGDPVYIDASAGTFGIVMAYTIDEDCVKIECFGAQGELQSAKAIEQSKIQGIANNVSNLENQMNEVFQSVSSGKDELAAAITAKGVTTYADDTFGDMAANVMKIQTGGGDKSGLLEDIAYGGVYTRHLEVVEEYTVV